MTGTEVTLPEILEAREQRVMTQKKLLDTYRSPLICFTMNIPGPVKQNPLILRGFSLGCRLLRGKLQQHRISVLQWESGDPVTGSTAFCVADAPSETLKTITTAIEDSIPLGRLFDMDVLDIRGHKLDRDTVGGKSRNCIVCGAPGRGCASRRLHTVPELQHAAEALLKDHFAQADARQIARLAEESLLEEVRTTPKPGLVDLRNTGSHRDMDVETFHASAHALLPYFRQCVTIGQQTAPLPTEETFPLLRQAGLLAERDMYQATGGINTHKGAVFTMGVLCGALGRLWSPEGTTIPLTSLYDQCAKLGNNAIPDFIHGTDSAGLRLYRQMGMTGIRGEVAAGLPSVSALALPVFQDACKHMSRNDAGVLTLLHLIANVEDTNLHHRGGQAGAAFAKENAAILLKRSLPTQAEVEALDDVFIEKNLSPGGCADLLAVTYFLDSLAAGGYLEISETH